MTGIKLIAMIVVLALTPMAAMMLAFPDLGWLVKARWLCAAFVVALGALAVSELLMSIGRTARKPTQGAKGGAS